MPGNSEENEQVLAAFGKRIKDLRRAGNWTQQELSELTGFDRTYISLVERGKRNISLLNLYRFATCLEIKPASLLEDLPLVE